MRLVGALVVLTLLLLVSPRLAAAPEVLRLDDSAATATVGHHLEVFEDTEGRLAVDEVVALPGSVWRLVEEDSPSFGYSTSTFWARLRIENGTATARRWVMVAGYAPLDVAELFVPDGGGWSVQRAGDAFPFSVRSIEYRYPAFHLELAPKEVRTIYLRVKSAGVVTFPIRIWQVEAFHANDRKAHIALGIFYGLMLAMVLFNSVLFFFLRDRSYLFYVLFLIALAGFELGENGLSHQYLWPTWHSWAHYSSLVSLGMINTFGIQFVREYLLTKARHARVDILARVSVVGGVVVAVCCLVHYGMAARLALGLSVYSVILAVGASLVSLRAGMRPARYFLGAWSLFMVGASLHMLVAASLLPQVFTTAYGLQLGTGAGVLLLAVGLVDRINILRHERELALRESVRDPLTDIANRRRFDEALSDAWQRSVRQGTPLSLVMVDVDFFKRYNDHYGHVAGDACLRRVASALAKEARRGTDHVARYGGEEFAVIMEATDATAARIACDRMRRAIDAARIRHEHSSVSDRVTVSMGLASVAPKMGDKAVSLVQRADDALYRAKKEGRNRLVTADVVEAAQDQRSMGMRSSSK